MTAEAASPRLSYLLSRLSDGLLQPAEAEELDGILRADAGAREHYRCHAAVHLALSSRLADELQGVDFPAARRAPRWPALAAAAALVLAGGTAWWSLRGRPQDPPPAVAGQETAPGPVLAVTSAAKDLRWNLPDAPAGGQRLGAGIVRIHSGELSLSLVGGQTVHLRGPAEFELLGDGEFALRHGPAAFRTIDSQTPFIVHLPKGVLVDGGSVFSAEVGADGAAEVHVFDRQLTASTVGESGRTLEELQLQSGQSILVNKRLSSGAKPAGFFLRVPPAPMSVPPASEEAYAAAILASSPAAYWRFESLDRERQIADETGNHPLQLFARANLGGSAHQRFLVIDNGEYAGFASTRDGIPGLDTARGVTAECLLFSSTENHGTALSLELAEPTSASPAMPPGIKHAPQSLAIERMGRKGERIGHLHPDFALRAMLRSPAGYLGGTNVYSRESHLLHRWIHVAVVHDGTRIRLYLDGELSDSTEASLPFNDVLLRPIIGRLQPTPTGELRQWIGGIDEVAIYGRALAGEEILGHASALKP